MITIYKNRKQIPKDMELVEWNDYYFNKVTSGCLDEKADAFIETIDHAERLGKYQLRSRFQGDILNIDKLSSGCKTVLNILYYPDKVFSIKECGDNALDCIYSLLKGNVYSEYPMISFEMDSVKAVDENGEKEIKGYEDLKEWWSDVQ